MTRYLQHLALPLLILAAGFIGSGCTILFGVAGASASGKPMASDAEPFADGTNVVLHLADGEKVSGKYRGTENVWDAAYYSRYDAFRSAMEEKIPLPAVGERLDVSIYPDSVAIELAFLGFGGYGHTDMIVEDENGLWKVVPLELVTRIQGENGWESTGIDYRRLAIRGGLPTCTKFVMETLEGSGRLPADDVQVVRKSSKGSTTAIGTLAGFAVDYFLWGALFRSVSSSSSFTL